MVTIKIRGLDKVKRALLDLEMSLSPRGGMSVLGNRIGRVLRDDARAAITRQDWPELGKWQRAKTGRRKVFIKERERIHTETLIPHNGFITIVYYNQRGDWKLTDHAAGYTLQPHGKFVTVKLADGRPLRLPANAEKITFRWKRPSVVPARRVFADRDRAEALIRPVILKWLNELKRKANAP